MQTANVGDFSLAYERTGSSDGEAVLLIHGGFVADTFRPMATEPALKAYHVVRYHRRGYGESERPTGVAGPREQATDARRLLDALDIERAHVVGHSAGGAVAFQLALDAPERLRSLSLLEPYLLNFLPGGAEAFVSALAPVLENYFAGAVDRALAEFIEIVFGERGRPMLDRVLPGAFDVAVRDFTTVVEVEMAGTLNWEFDDAELAGVTCPVLSVLGGETDATFEQVRPGLTFMGDTRDLILKWFPDATDVVLPRLNHLLMIEDAPAIAEVLADFFDSNADR